MSIDLLGMLKSKPAAKAASGTTSAAVAGADGGDFAGIMAAEAKTADPGRSVGGKAATGVKSGPQERIRSGQDQPVAADAKEEGRDLLALSAQSDGIDEDEEAPVADATGAAEAGVVPFVPAADQLMMAGPLPVSVPVEQRAPDIVVESNTAKPVPVSVDKAIPSVPVQTGLNIPPVAAIIGNDGGNVPATGSDVASQAPVNGAAVPATGQVMPDQPASRDNGPATTLAPPSVLASTVPTSMQGEGRVPILPFSGEQPSVVSAAANDDGALQVVTAMPKVAQDATTAAAQPGEATSLLAMAKSILPWRGRSEAPATILQDSGSVATISSSLNAASVPLSSPVVPAVMQQPVPIAASLPSQTIVPDGNEEEVPAVAEAVVSANPVVSALAGKASPARARKEDSVSTAVARPESHDKLVTGDEAEARSVAASVSVPASSPTLPDMFDIKGMGLSSPLVASPSSLSVHGVATAAGAVGASLDQKVIDMGVSGQWIDDIARQIASISDNQGRGSFQIASPSLGAVRVDILPGAEGSHVHLTAETEAAQIALVRDKDRLVQDAQMAAIRIGEVRIDRMAPVNESQRSAASHDDGQQGGNAQAGFTQNGGQNGQQGAGQGGAAAFAGQYSDGSPKNPFTKTVIPNAGANEVTPASREGRADTARYA